MKKFLIIALCFIGINSFAQEISKTYSFSNPKIINKDNYCMIEFENTLQSATLGNPMMPYYATELLLPPGCEASDVTLEFGELVEIDINSQLFPKQAVRPYSSNHPVQFKKNEETYSGTKYPESAHGILTTNFYRGHAIANVCFTPVVYNPKENKASYYSSVTVNISYKPSEKAQNALRLLKKTDNIDKKIQNTDMINKYSNLISESKSDDYDVLILSTAMYEDAFEPLRQVHIKYGLHSKFKALEEIYSEMEGRDNPERIRNYIIQEYENHSIEYVLLGGDVEVCPYRGLYCSVDSGWGYEDSNIPSDLYFSALDGTWNDNNNSRWGEIGEDDLEPEVSVARMPFSNVTELNTMIHKTISYQLNPVLGELNSPLLLGEYLSYAPLSWGADYLDLLVGERNDNGYFTNGIPETDPYDTMYDRDFQPDEWNTQQLMTRMNEGACFIHHAGHSNWNYTMRLYNQNITNNNFSQLDGIIHNFTLLYSHGCICGAFDENDCIAEKMLTIDNLAVSCIFNSRYGWFNEGQTEGPSAHIHREFVDALYTDKYNRLGRAHKESKIETAPWVTAPGQWEEGAQRWCVYCCNALGDPMLAIWRDEPYEVEITGATEIEPEDTTYEVNVTINGEAVAGTNCVIMCGDEFFGRAITDETGSCIINFIDVLPEIAYIKLFVSNYNTLLTEVKIEINNNINYQPIIELDKTISSIASEEFIIIEDHITISNTGEAELTFEITNIDFYDWLTIAPIDGIIQVNESQIITLSYDFTDVENGNYEGSFIITSNDPDNPEIEIALNVTLDYIGIEEFNNYNISLYPNPADNSITVNLNENNDCSIIEILNLAGQVVRSQKVSTINVFDISSLSSGTYIVKYGNETVKFVKR